MRIAQAFDPESDLWLTRAHAAFLESWRNRAPEAAFGRPLRIWQLRACVSRLTSADGILAAPGHVRANGSKEASSPGPAATSSPMMSPSAAEPALCL